ncbi:hypothetical protein J8631_00385 [Serratia fonticola]|uniref:hypothetical protein n=1 Tax=Serratia fonticola TaxID=47917 RepID=UPI001AE6C3FE|nr:hypothetical protein [Serratia fonticola]MBP1034010.1 hypothetical protein [Serratia fonticola]
MSEINFEALGRCEHLKEQINKAIRDRDLAFAKMNHAYRKLDGHTVYDTIHFADMEKLRGGFDELERVNVELTSMVDEYNRWAPQADKRPIKFVAW